MTAKYSRTHRIKCDYPFFENIASGRKRFEIRKDDRDYQVGDILILQCINNIGGYIGTPISVEIIYKTTYQQKDGYCVLGLDWPKEEGA